MQIQTAEIVALQVDERVICAGCWSADDWKEKTQQQLIIEKDLEDGERIFFCDECQKEVS